MEGGSKKAVLAAFGANLGIAVAKLTGFAFTGAASMLAEGIHSVADTANQALLLLGSRRARHAATPDHPFGFGRERFFWAFVVALVLFSMGGLFALTEGIEKLRHPHSLESPGWAVAILVLAVFLEGWSFRTAVKESQSHRPGWGFWSFIRRGKVPELLVVMLEDLGALIGLAFALAGVGLVMITGDARFDAIGSIAIGALLCAIAFVLAREMKSLLIGESASEEVVARIRGAIEGHPQVERLIHLRTEHLGPEELLVGAKVELDGALTFDEVAKAIDSVEVAMRQAAPSAKVIYLEPDVFRPERSPAAGAAAGGEVASEPRVTAGS